MNEDDESAGLAYQLELETRRWQEERDPGYESWLALEGAWYRFIDSDPNWITEHV